MSVAALVWSTGDAAADESSDVRIDWVFVGDARVSWCAQRGG